MCFQPLFKAQNPLGDHAQSQFEMVQAEQDGQEVILVTGGSGLVGEAIKYVVKNDQDPRYKRRENESWVFLTSKDGDLR